MSGLVEVDIKPSLPSDISLVREVEGKIRELGNDAADALRTTHFLHGGMYVRTLFVPAGIVFTGCLVKPDTTMIISGTVTVLRGNECVETLTGYNVLRCAGMRKQLFRTHTDANITVVFPTSAKTLAEAEQEFTSEVDALLSHGD